MAYPLLFRRPNLVPQAHNHQSQEVSQVVAVVELVVDDEVISHEGRCNLPGQLVGGHHLSRQHDTLIRVMTKPLLEDRRVSMVWLRI